MKNEPASGLCHLRWHHMSKHGGVTMLNIDHVVKNYGDFRLDVTMEVKRGCITGLVGRNGAGKSTTFKSILNLVCPESGSVQVFGTDSSKLTGKDRQKLGVVLADSGFS